MKTTILLTLGVLITSTSAFAQLPKPWEAAKKIAGDASAGQLEKEINNRLLTEARKNQCSFKSGTDTLAPGCDKKVTSLAKTLIDAKQKLNNAGVTNFKFEVSGHTDSTGDAAKNKELSRKRAAVMVKELIAKGVAESEIIAVGMGSEQMLENPDDTPAKKAKNRRYEIRVRL